MTEPSHERLAPGRVTPEQRVQTLLESAGLPERRWHDLVSNPEATARTSQVLEQIAALPQTGIPASVPFTLGRHVINVRPLVIPVLVAAVVKVAVAVSPNLESAILPWLDVVGVLERVNKIYKHLDDDEVDVFGAVASLSHLSETSPSVTDPTRFPSAEGIRNWFVSEGFRQPKGDPQILEGKGRNPRE